jgi:hypothetical protein
MADSNVLGANPTDYRQIAINFINELNNGNININYLKILLGQVRGKFLEKEEIEKVLNALRRQSKISNGKFVNMLNYNLNIFKDLVLDHYTINKLLDKEGKFITYF